MSDRSRPWAVGAFLPTSDRLFVAHARLPLVAELLPDGALERVHRWELDPGRRQLPPTEDLVLRGNDLVVASPGAGGLVLIDLRTGAERVIAIDQPVGRLLADGEFTWAIAHPDWMAAAGLRPGTGTERRPVHREPPTALEVAAWAEMLRQWGHEPEPDELAADDLDDQADPDGFDQDVIDPPTPVWVLRGDLVTPIDLGGQVGSAVAARGRLVADV